MKSGTYIDHAPLHQPLDRSQWKGWSKIPRPAQHLHLSGEGAGQSWGRLYQIKNGLLVFLGSLRSRKSTTLAESSSSRVFDRPAHERERMKETSLTTVLSGKCKEFLEARVGIEPTHKGFADLSLTTWVPRLEDGRCEKPSRTGEGDKFWSGRRDLNPRLRPWQGRTLPLSYSRSPSWIIAKA